MRSLFRQSLALVGVGVLVIASAPQARAAGYDDYHSFSEVEAKLRQWSSNSLVTLETIGRSVGGKPIFVVRVAASGPVDPDARQAVFVGANAAGFHNVGTEAALHLIETLVTNGASDELLQRRTFYVAPILNPDAHDALFAEVRVKREGNASRIDHDVDGLAAEDDPDDLNGDGMITRMRIPHAAGSWLPHPEEPRLMIRSDSLKERAGAYRLESEGEDDDGDGEYNEDPIDGVTLDRNFPHAHPYPDADAGPWPLSTPEAESIADWFFSRRNVGLALVYGPANNLLEMPQSLGGGGDLGTQKFKVPPQAAEMVGLDPEKEYTLDEVWDHVKDRPFIVQNNITKEQVAQFLGAGPATKLEDADQQLLSHLAKEYKEALKEIGQDERPAEQYGKGGFTPWLYYQYGILAIELDVWGIPQAKQEEEEQEGVEGEKPEEPLTVDRLETMSSEEFLALGEEKIAAFLEEVGAPAQYSAQMVRNMVESGQLDPESMAGMIRQMGGGAAADGDDEEDAQTKRARETLAWIDENAPEFSVPWSPVTLPDGTEAEVGGTDPFIELNPPMDRLAPAIETHTETVLDLASRMATVEIASVESEDLGGGVFRVRAVGTNRGFLPTHTKMAERARSHLPVRLVLRTGDGIELATGQPMVKSERLEGSSGTLEGEWLVRARKGAEVTIELLTQNAGNDSETHAL